MERRDLMAISGQESVGRAVVTLGSRTRRLSADFPGWGSPDHREHLLPVPAGMVGTVTGYSHHGSAPYTRYHILFSDGSRLNDGCVGDDFAWQQQ